MTPSSTPILVIEDDLDDQYFIRIICESLGVCDDLKFFPDGKSALEYLKKTSDQPFIIICDINLPGMNGLQFRKTINESEYLRKKSIPFVFFSTAASPAQVIDAYDMTVQGFFLKQQSIKDTKEILDTILKYWRKCIHPNVVRDKVR